MNLKVVRIIMAKELQDLFRDRRTIISMILIPIVAIPLLIMGMVWLSTTSIEKMRDKEMDVAIIGEMHALELSQELRKIEGLHFVDVADRPLDSLITAGCQAIVEMDPRFSDAYDRLQNTEEVDEGSPLIKLHYDSTQDKAKMTAGKLRQALKTYRSAEMGDWFEGIGLRQEAAEPWRIEDFDLASEERRAADMLSRFLPYLILILCLQGAMYPAMDLTAGEKERSTLETLLVNPVSRLNIVLGKYAAVSVMAFGSTVFTLTGQFLFFRYFADSMSQGALQLSIPLFALFMALLLLLPAVMLFSAILILLSTWARSMKEAQSYLGPLTMLVIFPSMASMIPGLELTVTFALIPIFNVALIVREVLMSDFSHANLMVLSFFANSLYALLALWFTVRAFRSEKVLFRS
jgi:sodium transport system permease protein